jgi:riboflavin synthase
VFSSLHSRSILAAAGPIVSRFSPRSPNLQKPVFTGLIQTVGSLSVLDAEHVQITGVAAALVAGLEIGDSVAVDGVCLTVTAIAPQGFVAVVSPETLRRSTLGQPGSPPVNLESSLRVGSKLGGHFVTGHVDGIGYLKSAEATGSSWEMTFTTDPAVARYIVSKGSIAINGISLTVANCDPIGSWFTVAVIPLTYAETNLSHLKPGSWVNLEGDILGKYVEKFLRTGQGPSANAMMDSTTVTEVSPAAWAGSGITSDFLVEHGYL